MQHNLWPEWNSTQPPLHKLGQLWKTSTARMPHPQGHSWRGSWGGIKTIKEPQSIPRLISEALHLTTMCDASDAEWCNRSRVYWKRLTQTCFIQGRSLGIPIWPECISIHWTLCFAGPPPPRRLKEEDQKDATVMPRGGAILYLIYLSVTLSFPPLFISFYFFLSHTHLLLNKTHNIDSDMWSHLNINSGRALLITSKTGF